MREAVRGEDADRDGLVAVVEVLGLRRLRREAPPLLIRNSTDVSAMNASTGALIIAEKDTS